MQDRKHWQKWSRKDLVFFQIMEEAESSFVYFKPKVGPCVRVCVTGKGSVYR